MRRFDGFGLLPPRFLILAALALLLFTWPGVIAAGPRGRCAGPCTSRWRPTYFDPAETPGIITPFMVLYALHDALVKPMPGQPQAPSLAEAWSVSPDGTAYEFVLRRGVRFHNGDLLAAEDVKFSFERYRGAGHKLLKERVKEVQIVDPGRVRFVLRAPWPDFMTFYGSPATGAGWIVPKNTSSAWATRGSRRRRWARAPIASWRSRRAWS